MCLVVRNDKHQIVKNNFFKRLFGKTYNISANIANEDIVTYKCLFIGINGKYIAPFRREFTYEIDKEYRLDNWETSYNIDTELNLISINEGFHSFRFFDFSYNNISNNCYKEGYFKAIIPKGSHYFIGQDGDIVSDSLKIVEIIYINDAKKYIDEPEIIEQKNIKKKRKRKKKLRKKSK